MSEKPSKRILKIRRRMNLMIALGVGIPLGLAGAVRLQSFEGFVIGFGVGFGSTWLLLNRL